MRPRPQGEAVKGPGARHREQIERSPLGSLGVSPTGVLDEPAGEHDEAE
jgi:hypothetical protein